MLRLQTIALRLRSLFRRRAVEEELSNEFGFHFDAQVAENIARGMAPDEARSAARRTIGNVAKLQDDCRDARHMNLLDDVLRDLRYAVRAMRRSPGFAALAVLIMALGIGANTAVFSVVNAVLLKPLAYRDPDQIVTLGTRQFGSSDSELFQQISIPNFQDWHDQSSSFEAMSYYRSREAPVMASDTAEYARGTEVGPEFFRVFAIEPLIGRFLTAEEMKPGGGGAAMISFAYWQSHFGGDPRALGQAVRVYGRPYPIAGVLPPGFGFPDKTDVWVPARVSPEDRKYRAAQNWLAVGRLKPSVSLERAQAEMSSIAGRLAQQYPESDGNRTVAVTRMRDQMVRDVRLTLYLLLGAVSVVLLIACANTATLLLARATARTREIAVRAAIGASRSRIVRQLITESLLLALLAGAVGILLAYGGSKALVALAPTDVPRLAETGTDRWVLGFTLCVSLITSFFFGLVPALYASKVDLNDAFKQGGTRRVIGGGMARLRGVLVVAEIALAVLLLSGAGLLIKSFVALHNVALGFRPENVLVMRATVPVPFQAQAAPRFFKHLLPRIANLPGVLSEGATMAPPGNIESSGGYFIDHMPAQFDVRSAPGAVLSVVAPGTFAALGIPLKSGRDFSDGDTLDRPLVAVVNEALARKAFAGQNPIGRTIFCIYDNFMGMTIMGVAGDVRQHGPALEPEPECYMPYSQHAFNGNALSIVARTVGDPTVFEQTLRRLARETSPDVPVKFTTMEARLSDNVAAPRFRTLLFGAFAALAACLAMAGVYGVMAYAVGQRSSEIGVRIALGASAGSILRLILGQGLALAGLGLLLGLAAATASARLLTSMLFEVKPNDPLTYFAVAGLLGMVALLASYVPARRASKINPMTALRCE
jgi:putative ABC transport system permease protein